MRSLAARPVVLALVLGLAAAAGAADQPRVAIDFAAIAKDAASSAVPAGPGAAALEPALVLKDQSDYLDYVLWQRDYFRRGWEWHLRSTQALFAIVLGIVGFGLWITWQQFKRDYTGRRRVRRATKAGDDEAVPPVPEPPPPSAGSIKVGPAGLELTSQIVGLLVLAMSLAFFYFYVKEVYPMREVARESAVQPPAPAAVAPKPASAPR